MLASTLDEYSRLLFSLFSPFYTGLSQPDVGVQELDATDDDYHYSDSAYYYMEFGFEE